MHIAINGNGHAYGHVLKRQGLAGAPDGNSHPTRHMQDPSTRSGMHHIGGKGLGIHVIMAKFADQLAGQPDGTAHGTGMVSTLISPLDRDGSMSLSSEEIAGTRLGQMIGDGFASIDTDSNGSLNSDELLAFIGSHLTESVQQDSGAAQQSEPSGDLDPSAGIAEDSAMVSAEDPTYAPPLADPAEGAAPDSPDAGPVDGLAPHEETATETSIEGRYDDSVRMAFETALEVLNSGSPSTSALEVVSSIYGEVQGMLDNELRA